MRIKINGTITPAMLKEINSLIEEQETSDRATELTTYLITTDVGVYEMTIQACEYFVDSITITAVNTCNPTDADKLKRYILENRVTQTILANKLGISKQALNQFLSGKRPVPKRILEKLK